MKQYSCSNCRRRKIKCDRTQPTCGQCAGDRYGPCEYNVPTGQEQLSMLEKRIEQLKMQLEGLGPPVQLTMPYTSRSHETPPFAFHSQETSEMPLNASGTHPMPTMNAQYYVERPHLLSSSNTIEQFPVPDLYTKAVTLHDAATKLSARDGIAWDDYQLVALDKEIDKFVDALPEVLSPALLAVHILAHLATIQLHAPLTNYHESSRTTALSAARSVSDILVKTDITNAVFFDAVLAPLLSTTSLVFIAEISRRLRAGVVRNVQVLRTQLETVIQAMQQLAHHSPLVAGEFERVLAHKTAQIGV